MIKMPDTLSAKLAEEKKRALAEMKLARSAWIDDPTDENWRHFCECKRTCRLLGCIF